MDKGKGKLLGNTLEFQATCWFSDDGQEYPVIGDQKQPLASDVSEYKFTVYIFGKTMDGKSVAVRVNNYCPSFLLHKRYDFMDEGDYNDVQKWIQSKLVVVEDGDNGRPIFERFDDHIVHVDKPIEIGTTLWGFTNFRKDKYYRFAFKSLWAYNKALRKLKASRFLKEKDREIVGDYQLFDVIDPLLQFAHFNDLNTAGWIKVTKFSRTAEKRTNCDIEVDVSFENVSRIERELICPSLLEMAFDIEVDSHDFKFPQPDHPANVVFQIGVTFKSYNPSTPIQEKILLHYGSECDPIEDTNVFVYDSERELLVAFANLIQKRGPDLIYTWNGDNFDWWYLFERAKLVGATAQFETLSPIRGYQCKIENQSFSSSAAGDNTYRRVVIPGRLNLDIMIFIKKDVVNKYDNYKLDTVADKLLNERKRSVTPRQIFEWYKKKCPELSAVIGDYCIQDTALVQRIVDKTDVVTQLFEMANITYTQVADLLSRGQQIKVYSQITKAAREKGFMTPYFERPPPGIPKGAIVLEPNVGAYRYPVSCLDFASLYPTIMMAFNMCYSTLVLEDKYANIAGVRYDNIEWEEDGIDDDGVKKTVKKVVRFAQAVTSVIPELQRDMFAARKAVKGMKKSLFHKVLDEASGQTVDVCTDEPRLRVLTGRELAIKVSMNSIYGFTSAFVLKMVDLTGAVTAQGRKMIHQTKHFMEDIFPEVCVKNGWTKTLPKLEAIGGDSVTGDTPILCQLADGTICYRPIDELISSGEWKVRQDGKEEGQVDVAIWTDTGFTRVKRIIRHYTDKRLFRVNTSTGIVDVTEDHSLLNPDGVKVKPTEVGVGYPLLHAALPRTELMMTMDVDYALFLGKSYKYKCKSRQDGVPYSVLNASNLAKLAFLQGFFDLSDKNIIHMCSKIMAAGLFYLFNQCGFLVTIESCPNVVGGLVRVHAHIKHRDDDTSYNYDNPHVIRAMLPLASCKAYVYDLETDNHHFGVGPGQLVVHNTDSVFIHFPNFTIKEAIILSKKAEVILTEQVFNRKPIAMEYEKTYLPYILIKKKNYIGKKYEDDDVNWTLDYKGIALKRRNYCPFMKVIYKDVIDIVVDDIINGPQRASKRVAELLKDLEEGRVHYKDLIITNSLRNNYTNENLPHVQLAKRMKERDEGSAPTAGDRFGYVIVSDFSKSTDLSARSEDPTFAEDNGIPIDALFYLNQQIRKPISKFLSIVGVGDEIEKVFRSSEHIIRWRQDDAVQSGYRKRNNLQSIEQFFKPQQQTASSASSASLSKEKVDSAPPKRFEPKKKKVTKGQESTPKITSFFG